MKRHRLITGIVSVAIGMILIASSVRAQESGNFSVPLSDPARRCKVKVHLNSGSITIKGAPRKDVLVKYQAREKDHGEHDDMDIDIDIDFDKNKAKTKANVKDKSNDQSRSKEGLQRISGGTLDLEVTENSNQVIVKSDSWSKRLVLELEIPAGADVQLHTHNHGDLSVYDVQGALELTNYNGSITAGNVAGSVVATTYNGEIKVAFEKVADDTPMSFTTYNGDIDLTFPASLKASLKMKTERGDIYTGFEVNPVKRAPVKKQETKSGTFKIVIDDWTQGDINGGGPEFTLKNYNGDIYVRKK